MTTSLQKNILLLICCLGFMQQVNAQQFNYLNFFSQPSYSVNKSEDLVYGVGSTNYFLYSGDGSRASRDSYNLITKKRLTLDLYEPQTGNSSGRKAVLILVPGSGRIGCLTAGVCDVDTVLNRNLARPTAQYVSQEGDNFNELNDRNNRAVNYARRGLLVISPITRYRYENQQREDPSSFLWTQEDNSSLLNADSTDLEPLVVDLKRVVRWLSHPDQVARYNIDTQNIFMMGASASGQMSSLTTMTPADTLLADDPAQLERGHPDYQFEVDNNNILVPQIPIRGAILLANNTNGTRNLRLMDENTGDFMFWHSTSDRVIYHGMDEAIEEKCEYVGCTTEFYSLPNIAHGRTGRGRALHTGNNQETEIVPHAYDFIANHIKKEGTDERPVISISRSTNQFNENAGTARIEIRLSKPATQDIQFTAAADQMREVTLENATGGRYEFVERYVAKDTNSFGPVIYNQGSGVVFERASNLPNSLQNRTVHDRGPGQGRPVLIPEESDYFFNDFSAKEEVLTIPEGQTRAFFNVNIINDTLSEDNECFKVRILNAQGARMSNTVETITILDDDNPNASSSAVCGNFVRASNTQVPERANVSVQPTQVNEGNGQARVEFTVEGSLLRNVVVSYRTVNGSARSGNAQDYSARQGNVTISPSNNRAVVTIPINDDSSVEGAERFFVEITNVNGAGTGVASAAVVINDNDRNAGGASLPLGVSVVDLFVGEGFGNVNMTVEASRDLSEDVTLRYRTFGGSATTGEDFAFARGSVTIKANRDRATISIPILDDDLRENNERFFVELQEVSSGRAEIDGARAAVTIVDNDTTPGASSLPRLSARSIFVGEGFGAANIVIQADQVVTEDVVISYQTRGDAARSSSGDYVFNRGSARMLAGRDRVTISIDIVDDTVIESQERFFLNLTNVTTNNAVLSRQNIGITIVDNDERQSVQSEVTLIPILSLLFE